MFLIHDNVGCFFFIIVCKWLMYLVFSLVFDCKDSLRDVLYISINVDMWHA